MCRHSTLALLTLSVALVIPRGAVAQADSMDRRLRAEAAAESTAAGTARMEDALRRQAAERRAADSLRDSLRREEAKERAQKSAGSILRWDSARTDTIRGKHWPDKFARLVGEGTVAIGMNEEMVRLAWGDPDDINTTTTANGTSEQWVFPVLDRYVYFENGLVTAIQE